MGGPSWRRQSGTCIPKKRSHNAWRSFCVFAKRSHNAWRSFCISGICSNALNVMVWDMWSFAKRPKAFQNKGLGCAGTLPCSVALVLRFCLGPVGLIWWVWTGRSGPGVLDLLCLDDVAPWILVNSSKNKAEPAKTNINKYKTY